LLQQIREICDNYMKYRNMSKSSEALNTKLS
jgi:hypothetical protein